MATTVAEGRRLLHIFLCNLEELLHSGSLAPLHSFFLIHRLVSQGQNPQPSVPLWHLLLGSELQVSVPSTRRQPGREVPPVSTVVLGLPQAPSPPPLLHPGVGTQEMQKRKPTVKGSVSVSSCVFLGRSVLGNSLEGLMLKLKLQYFGHLIQRTDSLEKTLVLGKIEGRIRRG